MFVNACTLTRAHAPVRFQRGVARLHTIPASLDRGAAENHATFAIRAATASAFLHTTPRCHRTSFSAAALARRLRVLIVSLTHRVLP